MDRIGYGVAAAVVEQETSSTRFEAFCNASVSSLEGGAAVLSTSASWDLGRDGRAVGMAPRILVCASLTDRPSPKAVADIRRLRESGASPERVYFCSSKPLSEHAVEQIKGVLGPLLPRNVPVEVLGSNHLAERATVAPGPLFEYYRSEVDDCIRTISAVGQPDDTEARALQLALASMGHDDSAAIRTAAYGAVIRTVLSDGQPRTLNELCRDVSNSLRLASSIPAGTLRDQVTALQNAREVEIRDSRWCLTDDGRKRVEADTKTTAANLLKGRLEVRKQIETEIGGSLSADHYAAIWQVIEEKVAHFFYHRGREMVAAVAALLGDEGGALPSDDTVPTWVTEIARAAASTSKNPQQAEEIKTAVEDLFRERSGAAFEWLLEACAAFVCLCSLGLEATSGDRLRRLVRHLALVPDTDVVLSLLGEGEPEHSAVDEIVARWRELGGELLLAEPVLAELSHHAWIAQQDMEQVRRWLPGSETDRLRLIGNAFVRSYAALMAQCKVRGLRQWTAYIDQYRGTSPTDGSEIQNILHEDYGFGELPAADREHERLVERVGSFLEGNISASVHGREAKIRRDKAKRDAALYGALVAHVPRMRRASTGASCFLVTSSGRLAAVERRFGGSRGSGLVLTIGGVLHILSLLPGVSVGLTAMRVLLFDGRVGRGVSDLQRMLLRVIRESDMVSLPFAKRTVLERELQGRIVSRARAESGSRAERLRRQERLTKAIAKLDVNEANLTMFKEALDAVVAPSRLQDELAGARRRIAELEAQLARRRGR